MVILFTVGVAVFSTLEIRNNSQMAASKLANENQLLTYENQKLGKRIEEVVSRDREIFDMTKMYGNLLNNFDIPSGFNMLDDIPHNDDLHPFPGSLSPSPKLKQKYQ